jgi:hypothetical protein
MRTRTGMKTSPTDQRWYVASCRDGDAHLAESVDGDLVRPQCDRRAPFRPFNSLAQPADAEQGCRHCLAEAGGDARSPGPSIPTGRSNTNSP